jgi:uncharacterized delta-60 repeat protein
MASLGEGSVVSGARRGRRLTRWALALLAALAIPFGLAGSASATSPMAVQADGKIVVGGATPAGLGFVARLEPDGRLDPGFGGGDGIVVDQRLFYVSKLAIGSDGGILAAASGRLARFLPDGTPDLGFGSDGLARFDGFPANALLVLADGRIAVGGTTHPKFLATQGFAYLFAADGRSEESLGRVGGGLSFASLAGLATLGDGSLILAGTEMTVTAANTRALLQRLRAGSPEQPFGDNSGRVVFTYPDAAAPQFLPGTIAADAGGLLVAGSASGRFALGRFDSQGEIDESFGTNGFAALPGEPGGSVEARDLALQGGGRIVAAGTALAPGCATCRSPLVARFLPGGALDPEFGGGGVARPTGSDGVARPESGEEVVPTVGGKMLISGAAPDVEGAIAVARLNPDGSADRAFGSDGAATVLPCPGSEAAQRRSGCLPYGQVRLRARRLSRGRPALYLRAAPRADWAGVSAVRLRLPRALRIRTGRVGEIGVTVDHGGPKPDRWKGKGVVASARGLEIERGARGIRAISLRLPPGLLRRVEKVPPGRRLTFRVEVEYGIGPADGGEQTFVMRRG